MTRNIHRVSGLRHTHRTAAAPLASRAAPHAGPSVHRANPVAVLRDSDSDSDSDKKDDDKKPDDDSSDSDDKTERMAAPPLYDGSEDS